MDELAKRFADLAEKFGPDVANAALNAARMEAYSTLMGGFMWLAAASAFGLLGQFLYKKAGKDDWDNDWSVAAIILFIVGGLVALPGFWSFVDPWTWATINHPELWLAKKAFHI